MRSHSLILILTAAFVVGCDREKREFRGDPALADTGTNVQLNPIIPGLPPATQPASFEGARNVDPNDYERNAFHLSEGQRLFTQMNCGTCHAGGGGGDIGPTLTDDAWIYGHEPKQIYSTLLEGRPNGMPAYGARMSQTQLWQLTAYVRSIGGMVPKSVVPGRQDNAQTSPPPNSAKQPSSQQSESQPSAGKNAGSQ